MAPYTSARRTQHQYEREERVRAGAPSPKKDWRCPICKGWFSKYRRRHELHLRSCEAKEAKRTAREERRQARIAHPVPSPVHFSPHSTPGPDPAAASQAPAGEHSNAGDNEGDQHLGDDPGYLRDGPEHLPGPLSSDEGPTNSENPSTSDSLMFFGHIIFKRGRSKSTEYSVRSECHSGSGNVATRAWANPHRVSSPRPTATTDDFNEGTRGFF